jgi:organic radical activating enzyme
VKIIYRNGKIHTPQLELNAAEHCNLRCVECSHLSPYVATGLLEPDSVARDLAALAPVLHCGSFRFVGGEPLLNKRLIELIHTVRESGVADRIVVVSNGTLIDKMADAFFKSIDGLEISWYPQTGVDDDKIAFAASRCAKFDARLFVNDKPVFRKVQIDRAIEDDDLVRLIYDSCRNAHVSVCHAIHNGYYYKCSRPIFSDRYLALKQTSSPDFVRADGVHLHEPDLHHRLARYIEDKNPLQSCRHCLGTAGKNVPHRQMSREETRSSEIDPRAVNELVDWKLLRFDLGLHRVLDRIDRLAPNPSLRHAVMRIADRLRPRREQME